MDDPQPTTPTPVPDGSSPEEPNGSKSRTPWLIAAGAGAVVIALAIVLAIVLLGGDDDSAEAAGDAATAARSEYVASVRGPVNRLTASAEASGRLLARASKPGDVARVARMADQQLEVVQRARASVADTTAPPAARQTAGTLLRASQHHRAYLSKLARLGGLDAAAAQKRLRAVSRDARRALDQYRALSRQAPGLATRITTSGFADLSGFRQALTAKKAAEEKAEEAASSGSGSSGGSSGGGGSTTGSSSDGRLAITSFSATDQGGTLRLGAGYCDRTPGAVNDFTYTFRIQQFDRVVASDGYSASQTRACNPISMSFLDNLPIGPYVAVVVVDNHTNGVSASATTPLTVR